MEGGLPSCHWVGSLDKDTRLILPHGLSGIASSVSSAQTFRGRQLLEQRLSSYQRNPAFFDTACDGALAVQRVEAHLRDLNELATATNSPVPKALPGTTPSSILIDPASPRAAGETAMETNKLDPTIHPIQDAPGKSAKIANDAADPQ